MAFLSSMAAKQASLNASDKVYIVDLLNELYTGCA